MKIFDKVLRVEMPDKSVWQVSAAVIATDRAKYYAEKDTGKNSGDEYDDVFNKEFAFCVKNDSEIFDWAANNMNWRDVKEFAEEVGKENVDYQEGWMNGNKAIVNIEIKEG